MSLIKRFERNTAGRDFAVGDIHGHFTRLQQALDAVGFDPTRDRLFSVGDLVDRGPECRDVLDWLAKPWFHPVRGNHDDYVCRFDTCDVDNWVYNGGAWFAGLPFDEQNEFATQFRDLPIGIEVETSGGLVGLLHADCVFDSWDALKHELDQPATNQRRKLVMNTCMWSRTRIEQGDERPVHGLRALVVGHTPLRRPVVLGNVFHIDTMGWRPQDGGYFTLLDLSTLEAIPPMAQSLEWEQSA
ncbi:metallophosphoesterase [Pseudomonas citronellolis]|uniref:metallophosphoesterase n=1 Tax=Pseudomonas citronellolis TaxID=53408 RepID=UPI000778E49F|nr:metallophosphoesterase [Pseudomonas citronellolis]AMO78030.1 Serine/threonine-protein phosphatase 2 [Pseudomonas citronellolis]